MFIQVKQLCNYIAVFFHYVFSSQCPWCKAIGKVMQFAVIFIFSTYQVEGTGMVWRASLTLSSADTRSTGELI